MNNFINYISGLTGGGAAVVLTTGIVTVTSASAAYYLYSSKTMITDIKPNIPLHQQSTIVDNGTERIYASKLNEMQPNYFLSYMEEDAQTLYETFRKGVSVSTNKPCLGWRKDLQSPYQWISYTDTLARAKQFGSGLISLGHKPHDFLGIYSQNCPEWVLFELGAYTHSMAIVPLYDTLGPDACAYIITNTNISTLIVADDKKINLILDKVPACLKNIIAIKAVELATNERAKGFGIDVHTFADIEKLGARNANTNKEHPPKPDDICTICYTSGTTGNPKGAIITHKNLVSNMAGSMVHLGEHSPSHNDVTISFLPLAHMIERLVVNSFLYKGGAVGFYSGDVKELPNDLKALRPTLMPIVPRLLNRVYDKIQADISESFIKRTIFNLALKSKQAEVRRGVIRKDSVWDRLVFRKIQDAFGGNIRFMIVGSAPLAGNIMTFSRCAFGCMINEGYGQTETTAPITMTVAGDVETKHVGPPLPCCCIKLTDVPEMNYYARENKGELCVKGANVFRGYYNDPAKTAEAIDSDGWLHTGDIGMFLPNGTLRIIDRRKHIFKLSQGEYIAPEKIENIYIRSKFIEQIFLYGESLKSCVIAIVVPDEIVLSKYWTDQLGNQLTNFADLCRSESVKKLILDDMIKLGKQQGLKSFEQVKDIHLHSDLFSVQNELLTPTLKLRRPQLKSLFKLQLDDMYKSLN